MLLRWLRNPSLQFFAAFFVAPLFAMLGMSIGGCDSPLGWTGVTLTFATMSFTGWRSARHERAQLPPRPIWKQIVGANSIMVRYIISVSLVTVMLGAGALWAAVRLVLTLVS